MQHDEISLEVLSGDEPSWTDPGHPMVVAVRDAAAEVLDQPIHTVTGLGTTVSRFWRGAGVPAVA